MDCLLWDFFVFVGLRHGTMFAGLIVFMMGMICVQCVVLCELSDVLCVIWLVCIE